MVQPYHFQSKDKVALFDEIGMGGVLRFNGLDGFGHTVYSHGIRNPAGISIRPKGDIWNTDNQVDGLDKYITPGELKN